MSFGWLKKYMPRSLYGRAALILMLPVVTLQLVVTGVFVQRHFEGVTEQLTRGVRDEIRVILRLPDWESGQDTAMAQMRTIADPLDYDMRWIDMADMPEQDVRRFYDLSGIVVMRELREKIPNLPIIALPDDSYVQVYAETPLGLLEFEFKRKWVSASNPHQLIVNMILFSLIMTPIAYVYLRNQLRPITRLAAAAEAFGRGRNVPYSPGGAVEVRSAGHAFLDMRARIERQIEQRTLMLSGVSHDLRTPLTRLKLGLSMIEEDGVEDLRRDVSEMEQMLEGFLAFARGDAEGGEAEMTDPIALVRQIVEDARRSGINADLMRCDGEGQLALRPMAIRRAVENLITNAVRYGTRAEVRVTLTDKSLRIRVEDDGPGIPEDLRKAATRAFVRLDKSRNQNRAPGVGLGLAISTDIARAHGGTLRLDASEHMGGLRADIVIAR